MSTLSPQGPKIAESKAPKKDRTHWLYIAVIISVLGGIAFGLIAPDSASNMKIVGTAGSS